MTPDEVFEAVYLLCEGLIVAADTVLAGEGVALEPVGEFVLFDVTPGQVTETTRAPEDYGVPRCSPGDLKGGDSTANAEAFVRVMTGDDEGPHRDALLMGASLVLEVAGQAADCTDGVAQAKEAIDSGRAAQFLDKFRTHFAAS